MIKFHENLSSGSRVVPCGRTDRRTVTTRLIVAFRSFASAPKDQSVKAVYTTPDLRNIYISGRTAQVECCAIYNWPDIWSTNAYFTYTQGTLTEIQTPAHGNLIDHSVTAPPPVLSPSSILPPTSSRCDFIPGRKNFASVSKMLFHFFIL